MDDFCNEQVISYKEQGIRKIYAFTRKETLYVNYWDGSQWRWANQGKPKNDNIESNPAAISFNDNGIQKIYTFEIGYDHKLYVNYWDGYKWRWSCHEKPEQTGVGHSHFFLDQSQISAITYNDNGERKIYAFVVSDDDNLYVNYREGDFWKWANQGRPPKETSSQFNCKPSVITYNDNGIRKIYAFISCDDWNLYVNYWDGYKWRWANQGQPKNENIGNCGDVISFNDNGVRKIYVFLWGVDGKLYVNYWDGYKWRWSCHEKPENTTISSEISAITYNDNGERKIYAFVRGDDGNLYVNYREGDFWKWANQGKPQRPDPQGDAKLSAITYSDNGIRKIYVFSDDVYDRYLFVNYWDGSQWRWANQGQPE